MTWKEVIDKEIVKDYYKSLILAIQNEIKESCVYPDTKDIYRALALCPFDATRVVILGQDPYYNGNADGLAFSCKKSLSPSLKQIRDAIIDNNNLDINNAPIGLESWAKQGVLLLNTVLTVRKEQYINGNKVGGAKSHYKLGWEEFTQALLNELLKDSKPKVFLVWGKEANLQLKYASLGVTTMMLHKIIEAEHPAYAAYSRKLWDCNDCFNNANQFLVKNNQLPIDWAIPFRAEVTV